MQLILLTKEFTFKSKSNVCISFIVTVSYGILYFFLLLESRNTYSYTWTRYFDITNIKIHFNEIFMNQMCYSIIILFITFLCYKPCYVFIVLEGVDLSTFWCHAPDHNNVDLTLLIITWFKHHIFSCFILYFRLRIGLKVSSWFTYFYFHYLVFNH